MQEIRIEDRLLDYLKNMNLVSLNLKSLKQSPVNGVKDLRKHIDIGVA
jgi:hypothetical protein